MTPGRYSLTIYRGDTYHWQVRVWSDAAKTVPVDLSNTSAMAQIRDQPLGEAVVAMTCQVTPPNLIDINLNATSSSNVPSNGVWDLQLTYHSNGAVTTLLAGQVNVTADVSTGSGPQLLTPMRVVR